MKRELFSTAVAAILMVPALAFAQSGDTERTPQAGMEGEQATEAPLGDAPAADPAEVPDGGSAAGTAGAGAQQGATGAGAETGLGAALTAEDLQGAEIIDAAGTSLGSAESVKLAADGSVEGVLVDVGGFLGIGAKTVMLTMDEIEVEQDPQSAEVSVTTDLTREEIKERPAHEG